MSNFDVALISKADALDLVSGIDDDHKEAFHHSERDQYMTYEDVAISRGYGYTLETVSQSYVDGTLPVVKGRTIFPR